MRLKKTRPKAYIQHWYLYFNGEIYRTKTEKIMNWIYTNGNQKTELYTYLSRRSLMKLIGLSAFGMGLGISACNLSNPDSAPTAEIKEESKMESTQSNATSETRIPPKDAAATAETSTATFALG
jgi:hypothetical protein